MRKCLPSCTKACAARSAARIFGWRLVSPTKSRTLGCDIDTVMSGYVRATCYVKSSKHLDHLSESRPVHDIPESLPQGNQSVRYR